MTFVNGNPTATGQEDFWVLSATITNARVDCDTNIAVTDLTGYVLVSRPSASPSIVPSATPSVSIVPSVSYAPSVYPSVAPTVAPSVSSVPSRAPSLSNQPSRGLGVVASQQIINIPGLFF